VPADRAEHQPGEAAALDEDRLRDDRLYRKEAAAGALVEDSAVDSDGGRPGTAGDDGTGATRRP
jgi:hypothetical protein